MVRSKAKRSHLFYLLPLLFLLTACSSEPELTALDIVRSTYDGENAEENSRHLQRYLHKDVSWTEAAGFPYAGTYVGWDAIRKHVFMRLADEWESFRFVPEAFVADAGRVVAYGTYSGTYKRTGKYMETRVAHVWKVQNKQIISFEQFVDSKLVADAMKETTEVYE